MRTDLTTIQVKAVVTHLRDLLGEEPDEQLLLDSLEGETDLNELVSRMLGEIEDAEASARAVHDQIAVKKERAERWERQAEGFRESVQALMEAATVPKLVLPEATVSLRDLKDRLIINKAAVPDDYMKDGPKVIDKPAIDAEFEDAEQLPNWLTRETGRRSLTIRRK